MNKTILITGLAFAAVLLLSYGFRGSSVEPSEEWKQKIIWTDAHISSDEIESGGKPVYLFVSTDWCTFCKKMKSKTFSDSRVQDYLNRYFVSIVIDPEKAGVSTFTGENLSFRELAQKLGVSGYPVSFFFTPEGSLIGGQPGYLGADQFADLAEYIGLGFYKNYKFNEFLRLSEEEKAAQV